jgi:hypothetical protein
VVIGDAPALQTMQHLSIIAVEAWTESIEAKPCHNFVCALELRLSGVLASSIAPKRGRAGGLNQSSQERSHCGGCSNQRSFYFPGFYFFRRIVRRLFKAVNREAVH